MADNVLHPCQKSNTRKSKNNCCVPGCVITYKLQHDAILYSFPWKSYESERRTKWIQAIHRINPDGSPWQPTKNHKICNIHFVGGKKCDVQNSPSYIPTIFPFTKRKIDSGGQEQRYMRKCRRNLENKENDEKMAYTDENFLVSQPCFEIQQQHVVTTHDVAVQVGISPTTEPDCNINVMFCCLEKNSANTQANICKFASRPTTMDVSTDPVVVQELDHCSGFHGYDTIKGKSHKKQESIMSAMCGIKLTTFLLLLKYIPVSDKSNVMQREDQLLIFLMKMKHGLPFTLLGTIFNSHRQTVSKMFYETLSIIYTATLSWLTWPSSFTVAQSMPNVFKLHYPKCRAIIDCTEIRIERPSCVKSQVQCFSNYKQAYTVKFLVAVTPSGYVCFVSKAYGGRATDGFITVDSGFIDKVEPRDIILADKGFPEINAQFQKKCVELKMPPFANANKQFTVEDVDDTYNIASVRIHVERIIQRLKLYHILHGPIERNLMKVIDQVIHVCVALANLQAPIIKE